MGYSKALVASANFLSSLLGTSLPIRERYPSMRVSSLQNDKEYNHLRHETSGICNYCVFGICNDLRSLRWAKTSGGSPGSLATPRVDLEGVNSRTPCELIGCPSLCAHLNGQPFKHRASGDREPPTDPFPLTDDPMIAIPLAATLRGTLYFVEVCLRNVRELDQFRAIPVCSA
jgi:hypothetical protein